MFYSYIGDSSDDLMAFFDGVAAVLGNVCDKMRAGNIKNELNDILKHSESFSHGILRIKKLLLKIFPLPIG